MGRKPKRRASNAKLAIAYIRVSTDSDRQALGLDAQRAAVAAWAAKEGATIAGEYVEEVSGGAALDKRPVLLEAIAALGVHGAGALVFQKWDRLARDPMTAALAEIEAVKLGARLVSADGVGAGDDPSAVLMRDMLLAFGRFEKAMIRARIKAALSVKQKRGEMTGAPPYGQRAVDGPVRLTKDGAERPVKLLVPDEGEQAVIASARALQGQGVALRDIVKALGPVSRTGKPFGLAALHAMLRG